MTPVRLEPAAPRSRVKHSTTEPLRSRSWFESYLDVVGLCVTRRLCLIRVVAVFGPKLPSERAVKTLIRPVFCLFVLAQFLLQFLYRPFRRCQFVSPTLSSSQQTRNVCILHHLQTLLTKGTTVCGTKLARCKLQVVRRSKRTVSVRLLTFLPCKVRQTETRRQ